MSAIESYNSLINLIKESLQVYLKTLTGIDWDSSKNDDATLFGYVNIYQFEPINKRGTKVHQPFAASKGFNLQIELKITAHGNSLEDIDSKLLNAGEYVSNLIENNLAVTGIILNHPNWKSPTALKGTRVQSIKKDIRQLSTGNQEVDSDLLYEGNVSVYVDYKV